MNQSISHKFITIQKEKKTSETLNKVGMYTEVKKYAIINSIVPDDNLCQKIYHHLQNRLMKRGTGTSGAQPQLRASQQSENKISIV